MIAGRSETVSRRRPARSGAVRCAIDACFDPAVPLQLKELLPHRFTGQLQNFRELRDRRRILLLERSENRAPAVWELIDGEDDALLVAERGTGGGTGIVRFTPTISPRPQKVPDRVYFVKAPFP